MGLGDDVQARLREALTLSGICYIAHLDDEPVAVFGAHDFTRDKGIVWMLATPKLEQHPIHVFRLGRHWLNTLHVFYNQLENYVRADNHHAIKWLKWLGFEVAQTPVTLSGSPYLHFKRSVCVTR